jgi:L,D-transpeptidase YcbB
VYGNEQVASAIEQFITSGHTTLANDVDDERLFQIFTFYHDRDFKPIWTRDSGPKTKARVLLEALKAAGDHGLDPARYAIPDLEMRIDSTNPEELAEFDLLMSDVFADFGRDLSQGRIVPSSINDTHIAAAWAGPAHSDRWRRGRRLHAALYRLAGTTDAAIRPAQGQARHLSRHRRHGRLAAHRGRPDAQARHDGPARAGACAACWRSPAIIPATPHAASNLYDPDLVKAIQAFQSRHGLTEDGVIGPATHAALEVPVEARIRQMEINMERRRWMADDLGERYVFVNIADAFLKVVEDINDREKTILGARLVVGKPFTRTPVFSDAISYLEFNPSWGVPASIANREFLPKLKENPGALIPQGIRMFAGNTEVDPYSVNWAACRRMPYQLRQDPARRTRSAASSSCFPTASIYIHDTPSKSLFERRRAVLLVRLHAGAGSAEPGRGPAWRPGLDHGQDQGRDRHGPAKVVNLKTKVPVHITYLTAWVNKDGTVHFRNDIYERDQRLAAALFGES